MRLSLKGSNEILATLPSDNGGYIHYTRDLARHWLSGKIKKLLVKDPVVKGPVYLNCCKIHAKLTEHQRKI